MVAPPLNPPLYDVFVPSSRMFFFFYVLYRLSDISYRFHEIKQDLEEAEDQYVLSKGNFMYVTNHDLEVISSYLPAGFRHAFLIRDPWRVYKSARKSFVTLQYAFASDWDFNANGYDMVRDDKVHHPLYWFERQYELWKHVKETGIDPNPIILDEADLLARPEETLSAFCDKVGLPFSDDLLQWSGSDETPYNYIPPADAYIRNQLEFFERAFQSSCFISPKDTGPISRDQLPEDVIKCVNYSLPYYQKMFENRLKV